jgi:hypothetical protein
LDILNNFLFLERKNTTLPLRKHRANLKKKKIQSAIICIYNTLYTLKKKKKKKKLIHYIITKIHNELFIFNLNQIKVQER